jgi:hypothetical protein
MRWRSLPSQPCTLYWQSRLHMERHTKFPLRGTLWSDVNSHSTIIPDISSSSQLIPGLLFWGKCFIGPYVLSHRLNGAAHWHFSEHTLSKLLDTVPLNIRRNLWYTHDVASAHFSYASRNYFETPYTGRWIRRQGPLSWPNRSPDLNPPDFPFWDI